MAIKKFEIPELLKDKPSHGACQGCGHGICWRIIYEVVEELGYKNKHVIFHDLACGSHGLFATHGQPSQAHMEELFRLLQAIRESDLICSCSHMQVTALHTISVCTYSTYGGKK